jgi:hypothetical protein
MKLSYLKIIQMITYDSPVSLDNEYRPKFHFTPANPSLMHSRQQRVSS